MGDIYDDWLLNPNCAKEEAKSMPSRGFMVAQLQAEVAELTDAVSHWKARAYQAESALARRDASIFTATGRSSNRGVQFGGRSE